MKIIFFIISLTTVSFLQAQEQEPTVYSEIFDNYSPRNYYRVKNGQPNNLTINDTIILNKSETWIEKNIYTFESPNKILVKKFRNDSLAKDEIYKLDSIGRLINYEGNIKYSKGEWYITRLNFTYESNKKIIEKINRFGKIHMRYEVEYDSLKNPIILRDIIVGPDYTKLESVKYDYKHGIFTHMDFNYDGNLSKEEEGYINLDYVIDRNKFGDITRMYWMTSNKQDNIIYDIEYVYDQFNNWIKMVKILNTGNTKKVYSKTYRKINYNN
ncbi:hypothetical protein FF125_19955 [Aureibaculum algae]|uniref:Uncharacterized protein n=1 Tax=Aureibaculum algae TaxID=2584122 RepID=A0A5B7TZ51_9FLAO|nr:hypothetical protein [Aureibaculum algae]QCX40601.1 hypothetical protein FF125_19955 [Aureibaculum algae]